MSNLPENIWEYELLEVPEDILGIGWYSILFHPNPEVTREVWILRIFEDGTHKVVKQHLSRAEYMMVGINLGTKLTTISVHRLVAFACFGKCPDGYSVDHIKSDEKLNNHPSNLRYSTRSEQAKNRNFPKTFNRKKHISKYNSKELGEICDIPFDTFQKNGYRITSTGLFIGLNNNVSVGTNQNGYYCIRINKKTKLIHQLVAEAFLKNTKESHHDRVNHKNNNGLDNRIENLEWCDAKHNGAHSSGKKIVQICPKEDKIITTFPSISEATRNVNCYRDDICKCLSGKRKTAKGYAWALMADSEITIQEKKWIYSQKGKSVVQIDINTCKIINTFNSLSEAAKSVNGTTSNISHCINGKIKTCYGYAWSLLENAESIIKEKRWIYSSKKKVHQIDINTNKIIKEFVSISDAAIAVGGNHSCISQCISGKYKTCYGFKWSFSEDVIPTENINKTIVKKVKTYKKKIQQIDIKTGKVICTFDSISDAAKNINGNRSNMTSSPH